MKFCGTRENQWNDPLLVSKLIHVLYFLFICCKVFFSSPLKSLWKYMVPGSVLGTAFGYHNAKLVHILCLLFYILGLMSYDPRFFHCSYFYPFCRMQDLFSGQMRCLLMLLNSTCVLHSQKMESHLFQRFLSFLFPYFLLCCQTSRHIWRCKLRYVLHLGIVEYFICFMLNQIINTLESFTECEIIFVYCHILFFFFSLSIQLTCAHEALNTR